MSALKNPPQSSQDDQNRRTGNDLKPQIIGVPNEAFLKMYVDVNQSMPVHVKQFVRDHIDGKTGFWNRKPEEPNAVRNVVFDPIENVVIITLGDNMHVRWSV